MCSSGDQCYRYWDNCDGVAQCADASDESVACQVWPLFFFVQSSSSLVSLGPLKGLSELTQRSSKAFMHCLLPELQRYKDTVLCAGHY